MTHGRVHENALFKSLGERRSTRMMTVRGSAPVDTSGYLYFPLLTPV